MNRPRPTDDEFNADEERELMGRPRQHSESEDDDDESGDNAEYGTSEVGYVGSEEGPFRCDTCLHFKAPGSCDHPEVIEDDEVQKNADDTAKVAPGGCCNYWRPKEAKS
jgi:hypothetical protein